MEDNENKIKVMIVDDEYLERILISKIFDYEKNGLEIIGDYKNGKEAISAYIMNPADIILVDINMPILNGLELSQKIKEVNSNAEIIIISGFNDFEYAKTAIKIGVRNYLLKPINKNELEESLIQSKNNIMLQRDLEKIYNENVSNKRIGHIIPLWHDMSIFI
ncbi:MAG: response regulator [Clostridiales Family XIII bacterium]|jgi:two-component system response regulator YesN|nr:response regulator [Clostridiales Family XIII bacterium]